MKLWHNPALQGSRATFVAQLPGLEPQTPRKPRPMSRRSILSQTLGFLGWLAVAFATAAVGAVASIEAKSFYAQLVRPAWAPPASVFGPVWSVLYALMGVSAWLVWREKAARHLTPALALFVVQLCVNALWSWLFFAWHQGAWAFADVLLLLALIAATIAAFWPIRRLAAVLMLPYLAWVCLASALTWSVWRNNPGLL
jgi:tryptophan-rich sensory protein